MTGQAHSDILRIYDCCRKVKGMEVQVREWGNSQGIRFPKAVLQEAGIEINDKLTLKVEDGKIILFKAFRHRTLEERIRDSGCELSGIGELDWGEAQGNEVW